MNTVSVGINKTAFIYTIIIFGIIIFVSFKIKVPKFSLVLFILSMLSKLLAIMLIKPPIESDFLVMYQASKLLRVGDLSYTDLDYFRPAHDFSGRFSFF